MNPNDAIIDLSQPGVIHYIYPTGKKVPEHMMDPNLGGNYRKKENNMIYHKHLLVNAKVRSPMREESQAQEFLTELVDKIDMKIIKGPFASYVDKEGNRGLTAIVMIETSHIAFHIWDEGDPSLVQFDLYTCGRLELDKVISLFKEAFDVITMDYQLIDREHGFVVEAAGSR